MRNLKIIIVISVLCLVIACGNNGPANTAVNNTAAGNKTGTSSNAAPATPADELASGKALYEKNCAACHGEDGTGGKKTIEGKTIDAENLTEDKFKRAEDAKIFKYIHDGVEDEGMPAFKDKLTEAQINEVIKYVRVELQKVPAVESSPASSASPSAK